MTDSFDPRATENTMLGWIAGGIFAVVIVVAMINAVYNSTSDAVRLKGQSMANSEAVPRPELPVIPDQDTR